MVSTNLTPKMLDWAINGIPVHIHRRPQLLLDRNPHMHSHYATIYDFARYNVPTLEVIRVPVPMSALSDWDPTKHESVLARLKALNAGG